MAIDRGQVREIFDRAVEMNPTERSVFLADICGDDREVRTEVESLLLANDQAGSFLDKPATPALASPLTKADTWEFNGRRIGQYQMLRELGRGGMGVVYLAVRADGEFHKQVAIKVLRPGVDPRLVNRFRQERQILADLEHPNIARLMDGGTTDGMPYVVMEYVEGQSLRAILKARDALPLDEVVEIAKQVCAGLDAAHQQGVIHRDIKPENLIVAERSQQMLVKILDFGIARLNGAEVSSDWTQTGMILGTVAYMSPEQAAGATHEQIDARADVYSLGMVIYEMLTGRVAFAGDAALAIINRHLHEKPMPPSQLRPDLKIHAAIERVVLKALEKDREQRQQTIRQLAEDLEVAHRLAADSPHLQRWSWRRFAALIMLGLLVGGAIFLAVKRGAFFSLPSQGPNFQVTPVSSPIANGKNAALQYRVIRRSQTEEAKSLAPQDALQEGDQIHFEFVMPFQGAFYLFYEGRDGSMVWANPGRDGLPQTSAAEALVRVPEKNEITMGGGAGQQNFLAVYVPAAAQWSLKESARPGEVKIHPGPNFPDARIAAVTAARIKTNLSQKATDVTLSSRFTGGKFVLELTESLSTNKPVLHRIKLNQEAQ